MTFFKKSALGLALAATALTGISATPAAARDNYRHNNGDDGAVAAIIGIGILGAVIAAVVSSDNRHDRDDGYYGNGRYYGNGGYYYGNGGYNQGYGNQGYDNRGRDSRYRDQERRRWDRDGDRNQYRRDRDNDRDDDRGEGDGYQGGYGY